MEFLPFAPKINRIKRAKNSKVMKGRPITAAEFRLMLDTTPEVVGKDLAGSWTHYLEGLWLSGLRLAESLQLFWDDSSKLCVCSIDGDLMMRIPAELEKGHQDRLLAVAPDFAGFLEKTPPQARHGPVFTPRAQRVHAPQLGVYRVSETIRMIGQKAGVVVDQQRKKYASAHDLSRSFGERWAAWSCRRYLWS